MKFLLKTTFSLLLVLIFFTACFGVVSTLFIASWLHTYKVFTLQTPIAKVQVSEQRFDEKGPYIDVILTEVKGISPIAQLFIESSSTNSTQSDNTTSSYKLYGDVLYIGGPVIKFEDIFTLFNVETAYKIGQIQSEYSVDLEREKNRTAEMFSTFDLNGGLESWRRVAQALKENSFEGKIYDIFIDSVPQIHKRGLFILDVPQSQVLCVTEEGFFFCDKELD